MLYNIHLNDKLRNTWSQLMSETNYTELAAVYFTTNMEMHISTKVGTTEMQTA